MKHRSRCAVYTRKSSEEGLDQAFSSLDAQRQAGLDYIASQRHEGWVPITTRYDDGGRSGGTMERPALKRLLDDIAQAKIDVVVVYKVDRLSRSLADFARMMQHFEKNAVSFVSVTQQFSTTSSMGRLTLNMLLSFAQFEREVAGERIRDKIAATVRQGYWVCGRPPFGYRIQSGGEPRGLYIVPEQAEIIRRAFEEYSQSGSLLQVAKSISGDVARQGRRQCTPGFIHRVITNPVYLGKVTHTDRHGTTQVFEGRHEPIVDAVLWQQAQSAIVRAAAPPAASVKADKHWLKGKLRTIDGFAMSPSSVKRRRATGGSATGQQRIVRYYTSQGAIKHGFDACPIKTLNAQHVEDLVEAMILDHVESAGNQELVGQVKRDVELKRRLIESVVVSEDQIRVTIDKTLVDSLRDPSACRSDETAPRPAPRCLIRFTARNSDGRTIIDMPIAIKRLDGKRRIVSPGGQDLFRQIDQAGRATPNPVLVEALAKAHRYRRASTRSTVGEIARSEPCSESHVKKLIPLAYLAPAIVRSVLDGTASSTLTIDHLVAAAKHLDWQRQLQSLGMPVER